MAVSPQIRNRLKFIGAAAALPKISEFPAAYVTLISGGPMRGEQLQRVPVIPLFDGALHHGHVRGVCGAPRPQFTFSARTRAVFRPIGHKRASQSRSPGAR
jgi:hypothetical protein